MKDLVMVVGGVAAVFGILVLVIALTALFYGLVGFAAAWAYNSFAVPAYDLQPVIWWHVSVGLWVIAVVLKAIIPSRS